MCTVLAYLTGSVDALSITAWYTRSGVGRYSCAFQRHCHQQTRPRHCSNEASSQNHAVAQVALVVQPRLPCLQRLQCRALQSGAERLRALLESTQQPLRRGPCIRHGDLAVAGLADAQSCHHHIMKAGAVQASTQNYCKTCSLHNYHPLHHGAAGHTEIVC